MEPKGTFILLKRTIMRKRSGLKKSDAKMKELTEGLEEWPVVVVFPTHRALEER